MVHFNLLFGEVILSARGFSTLAKQNPRLLATGWFSPVIGFIYYFCIQFFVDSASVVHPGYAGYVQKKPYKEKLPLPADSFKECNSATQNLQNNILRNPKPIAKPTLHDQYLGMQ